METYMNRNVIIGLLLLAAIAAGILLGFLLGRSGKIRIPAEETSFTAYLTGYSYFDNTPKGSLAIAFPASKTHPTVHLEAGGSGTYNDPVTLAVGHAHVGGVDMPDFVPGTRVYVPDFKKYFVVEDECGDGATPQKSGCHAGYNGYIWLDVWVGGQDTDTSDATSACEHKITGLHTIVLEPSSGYPVQAGSVLVSKLCE